MARKRLSEKEIGLLLGQRRSERRVLMFQLDDVRRSIGELKQLLKSANRASDKKGDPNAVPVKRGPGRPRKYPPGEAPALKRRYRRKPGRKASRKGKTYRPSEWDQAVLNAIASKKMLMTKSELLAEIRKWAAKNKTGMKPVEVETHLTRTLQKLSTDQRELGTYHSGLIRGNHYGLKQWFFSTTKKLRPQHLDKLDVKKG